MIKFLIATFVIVLIISDVQTEQNPDRNPNPKPRRDYVDTSSIFLYQ